MFDFYLNQKASARNFVADDRTVSGQFIKFAFGPICISVGKTQDEQGQEIAAMAIQDFTADNSGALSWLFSYVFQQRSPFIRYLIDNKIDVNQLNAMNPRARSQFTRFPAADFYVATGECHQAILNLLESKKIKLAPAFKGLSK